jgi:DNA-binding IclR family transcriptional regulator
MSCAALYLLSSILVWHHSETLQLVVADFRRCISYFASEQYFSYSWFFPMAKSKVRQVPYVQSLDRGLRMVHAVALSGQPVSLGELTELLGIDRSNVLRLANTLRRRGFLTCPAGKKDYILGSSMWRFSHRYNWGNMLIRVANQHLKLLASQLNETAHLAIREGKHVLFIDHAAASNVVTVAGRVGELAPLYCTAHGKALLADADERELRALMGSGPLRRYTMNTLTSIQELSKECALIKKRGFATDEAEFADELRCIAAPVRVENDVIVGSIGISAPLSRFTKERYKTAADHVCKVARDIGILLTSENHLTESRPESSVAE